MIIINQSQINVTYLTLTEKVSVSSPIFLFEFINDQDKTSQYFISEDLSTQDRYNKFHIEEKTNPDNLEGEVRLEVTGSYTYIVREQESNTNLDPDLSGAIVETGKVKVIGTSETTYT